MYASCWSMDTQEGDSYVKHMVYELMVYEIVNHASYLLLRCSFCQSWTTKQATRMWSVWCMNLWIMLVINYYDFHTLCASCWLWTTEQATGMWGTGYMNLWIMSLLTSAAYTLCTSCQSKTQKKMKQTTHVKYMLYVFMNHVITNTRCCLTTFVIGFNRGNWPFFLWLPFCGCNGFALTCVRQYAPGYA